jgi:rhamnosyltransferase subunit B
MKSIVITTFGSYGDLHPYLAIALGLKARGHSPVLATSSLYQEKIEGAGIQFYPVRPNLENLVNNPEIMRRVNHLRTGTEYVVRKLFMPHLRASYEDLSQAAQGADLLITHPLTYAGRLVAEKQRLPWISTVLSPLSFMSTEDPSVMAPAPWFKRVHGISPSFYRVVFGLMRRLTRSWSQPVRTLRKQIGLAPSDQDPLFEGQFSPYLNLALFSAVLAKPQTDWPQNAKVTGFPIYDSDAMAERDGSSVEQFLRAGEPPLVFTLGSSAVFDARGFFRESAIAARRLGKRAILITGPDPGNRPAGVLSEDVVTFDYIPHSRIFPRASVNVHQGGIGTLAQAMRSGHPMLIVPFSHDQPDNAARAMKLGIARSVARLKYSADRVVEELRLLLEDSRYARTAADLGSTVRQEDGVSAACDAIEPYLVANPQC